MSETSTNLVYACDQWEIDLGRRELRSRGIPVPLGGRAFEIVKVLVQTTGLVTRNHMMEQVWPGIFVSEGTIRVHISAVRKALGQDRAMLRTVYRSRLLPARELGASAAGGDRRAGLFTPDPHIRSAAGEQFFPSHYAPDRSGRGCAVCPRPRLCLSGGDLDGPRWHREDLARHQSRPLPAPRL